MDHIVIKGAKTHNLKNVDVAIPRNRLVIITGLSGSGKSSLAFDTLFAEGQRRYVESLSTYARQFLDQMDKPDVDSIEGLSPSIAIEQKNAHRNPRSSVGTITEVYDHLRLLWARIGHVHCHKCGERIQAHSISQMVDKILTLPAQSRFSVLAPVVTKEKGDFAALLGKLRKDGFVRALIDDELIELSDPPKLDAKKTHTIEVYVDRLVVKDGIRSRLSDSVQLAATIADGLVKIAPLEGEDIVFSEKSVCASCGTGYPDISPKLFSFNNPVGACPGCAGIGARMSFDPDLIVKDPELSLNDGAIEPWERRGGALHRQILETLAQQFKIDLQKPWRALADKHRKLVMYGSGTKIVNFSVERNGRVHEFARPFEGVIANLQKRFDDSLRRQKGAPEDDEAGPGDAFDGYMKQEVCAECEGTRLRIEARHVRIAGRSLDQVSSFTIAQAADFFDTIDLPRRDRLVADRILREVSARLSFLLEVGLDYLTLDRSAATLSGGEAQRIRLATQIGAGLVGVLYVLDEPSIGLHQRDNQRLVGTLKRLRDMGNSVVVVAHDEDTIRAADHIIDMGPKAGVQGGRIIAQGTPQEIIDDPQSLTGAYLAGEKIIALPNKRRETLKRNIRIQGAHLNNLKDVDVSFPVGVLTCVTGVSGSGKSSLVTDTLLPALKNHLHGGKADNLNFESITGLDFVDGVIDIDQSPIGRSPRSNPATYTGIFAFVRELFAELPESKTRGYKTGRYSFNVKGGRCESCQGDGTLRIEMHFLPDVYVQCEACEGRRYNRETLAVQYKQHSIADVLDLTVDQAYELLEFIPRIGQRLEVLRQVGLGYVKLGQPANTLSGGEAQRIKLAKELIRKSTGNTVYILDEPTSGLHFADIDLLLGVLGRLVDAGNTMIIIEHNLDVVKNADWVIDVGPEGGPGGGQIVAEGRPNDIAKVAQSHTGRFLKALL